MLEGPRAGEQPGGAGLIEVIASSPERSEIVLGRVREVMTAILSLSDADWLSTAEWRTRLPDWFVASAAPERSQEEAEAWLEAWRAMPEEERQRVAQETEWTLDNWLFWLDPDERQWFWWNASIEDEHTLRLVIEVEGWPVALGALKWLLRAAGVDGSTIDIDRADSH